MGAACGRCRVVPAEPGEAWCVDCQGEDSPDAYAGGVHVSQIDPAEVRHLGCGCPTGGEHAGGCPAVTW